MKHSTIFLIGLILAGQFLQAQNKAPEVKFGAVSMHELESTACNYAPDAKAEYLINKGELDISLEGVKYYVHRRIKVYTNDGKAYATIEIPLYIPKGGAKQALKSLKAVCYNLENGQIVETKLKKEDKFEKRINENWKEISFVIPNVKVGSVFEYTYRLESDYYRYVQPWKLHFDVPVMHNIFDYKISEEFLYKVYFTGNMADLETGKTGRDNWSYDSRRGGLYGQKNLPIYEEPYQPNVEDVYGKVNFQLVRYLPTFENFSSDYDALNKKLLESNYFGRRLNKKGILKALNLAKRPTDEAFAKDIFERLRGKLVWNNIGSLYSEDSGKSLVNGNGEGNLADINLTLVAALNEAGFEAAPILASTRGNGIPHPVFADIQRFNYLVAGVKLPQGWVVLDATSALPFGEIAYKLLNFDGYIVHKTLNGWHKLKAGRKASNSIFIQATFKDKMYSENVTIKYTKYNAYSKIAQIKEEGLDAFKADFTDGYENEISGFTVSDAEYEEPLVVKFTTSLPLDEEDILYIEPINYCGEKKNPFEREIRYSGLNFPYSISEKVIYKLNIDENWAAEPISSQRLTLEDKKSVYSYWFSAEGNTIDILSDLALNETFYNVEEYAALKQFFEGYTTLQNELLVLKRKQ